MSNDPSLPTAAPAAVVNVGDGNMGIIGMGRQIMHMTSMAVITMILVWLVMWWMPHEMNYNRELMRESIKSLQDEANRHTGEIKGALDKNTDVMRELMLEIKMLGRRTDKQPDSKNPPLGKALEKTATELRPIPQKPPN